MLSYTYKFTACKKKETAQRADGGSDEGGRGRGGGQRIEDLAGKGLGTFALANDDQQRLTERQKMARRMLQGPKRLGTWLALVDVGHGRGWCVPRGGGWLEGSH